MLDRALRFFSRLRKKRMEHAAHDISDGGMVACALEMLFRCPLEKDVIGLDLEIPRETDVDRFLFGEAVPRVLIAYDSTERTELEGLASQAGIEFTPIGQTNDSGAIKILQGGATVLSLALPALKARWRDRWKPLFD